MTTPEPHQGLRAVAPHPVLDKYYASAGERQPFVTALFDGAAGHYDWICRVMSLGLGQFYRRDVLRRAGLSAGMRLLDVATGTGLCARAALSVLGDPRAVVGVDPSGGMLKEARRGLAVPLVQGRAEALPFADDCVDFLSLGFALRHLADLELAFGEYLRVLKPGGRVVILEISRPRSAAASRLLRAYFRQVLPLLVRFRTKSGHAVLLTRYYWDTIAECVPPSTILGALERSGFVDVTRHVLAGLFSEYVATKPRSSPGASRPPQRLGEHPVGDAAHPTSSPRGQPPVRAPHGGDSFPISAATAGNRPTSP